MSPDFGKGVFICSKPLQFLMCAGIVRRYAVERPEIYVVTHALADVEGFFSFLRSSAYAQLFEHVHRSASYPAAVEAVRETSYDSLFVEDDRVSLYHLFAPLKRRSMAVFEEGIGTYRNDYRASLSGLRRLRWKATSILTGCGLQFGDGRATDHVVVQYPEVYARLNPRNAHKVLPALPFGEEIEHLADDWRVVVEGSGVRPPRAESRVAFILGTWGGAPREVLDTALAEFDEVYYKAHPHDGIVADAEGVEVISASWVPAEVYISYLARHCEALTVYHFSSSVHLNCRVGFDNVTFTDLLADPRFVEVRDALEQATH